MASADQAIGDANPQKAGSKSYSQELQAVSADCACALTNGVGDMSVRHPLEGIVRAGIKEANESVFGAIILCPATAVLCVS